MTRAAIYARYSTDNQSARSVADQIALCEAHATRLGYQVVERYSDSATSGQVMNRPGFMAMMKAARAPAHLRAFDCVVVESADRLSRHAGDIHHIRDAFAFAEIPIIQVEGGELDAMKAAVSGLVSSLTIKSTIEKTIRGMSAKARDGLRMGGRLYGYRPVKGEPGVVEVDPEQAAIVRRIFSMYISGDTPRTIAHKLTAEGIRGPRGGTWTASAIGGWAERGNGILQNEAYCGVMIFGKVKMFRNPETRKRISRAQPKDQWIRVPRPDLTIIDRETFERAQERRRGRMEKRARVFPKHLLSGLVRCHSCGGGMSIKDGQGEARRITCTNHHANGTCQSNRTYYLSRIERAVVGRVRDELEHPEALSEYARTYNTERRRLTRQARDSEGENRAELAKVTADLDRAVEAVISGTMSQGTAAPHIARLEARKAALEGMVQEAEAGSAPVTIHSRSVARYRAQVRALAQEIEKAAVRGDMGPAEAFRKLVTSVTIQPNYEVEITGNLAPLLVGQVVAGDGLGQTPPNQARIPFVIKAAA